jgi:hypothetical protein
MGSGQSALTGAQGAASSLGQSASQVATTINEGALGLASGLNTAAQTTAALGQSINTLRLAMANLQRTQGGPSAVAHGGGASSYYGGNDEADPAKGLREYEASLSAKTKEDTIRRIARALKRAAIDVDPEGDLDVIVTKLAATIPNPRKNRKSFTQDAEKQKAICQSIARVLNDEFTPGATKPGEMFIDTSLSAAEVCRMVAEWVHSFAACVNTEFLATHASVKNVLRAVEVLEQIMAETYAKIKAKVDASGDAKLRRDTDPLAEVYSRAQSERKRQEELLKNILHVQLAPAMKELEHAMREESEEYALIKRLGLKPGTGDFADSLAMAISGLGTAAGIAQRVNKALKQVGVSVSQYLGSASYAEFERLINQKIESGSIKADDLAAFLEAAQTLRMSFEERKEVRLREALEEAAKTGGSRASRGGDDEKSSIDTRVEKAQTEKSIIIRTFVGQMTRHYNELLSAVKVLAPELGKKIPITEKTDALRDALVRLRDMRQERIELALVGYYADADARERKERFLSALRLVSSTCDTLMGLEIYRAASPHFARLKAAIDALTKTIDYYSDVIVKKFGGEKGDEVGDTIDSTFGTEEEEMSYFGGRRKRGRPPEPAGSFG